MGASVKTSASQVATLGSQVPQQPQSPQDGYQQVQHQHSQGRHIQAT